MRSTYVSATDGRRRQTCVSCGPILNIIQDDDDDDGDKAKYITTMNLMYEAALLTVIASWPSKQLFSSANYVYQHQEIILGRLFVRRGMPHYFEDSEEKASLPIMDRAWIYQERILSNRAVYFTENKRIGTTRRARNVNAALRKSKKLTRLTIEI